MIFKSILALSICVTASLANAGYGEINSVGDVRQLNNVTTVQSTVTESPTWSAISKNAAHYVVEDKNADAKSKAKLKADADKLKAQQKAAQKAESKKAEQQLANEKAEAKRLKAEAKLADKKLKHKCAEMHTEHSEHSHNNHKCGSEKK